MAVNTKLKIIIELDGIQHVKVAEKVRNDTLRVVWSFSLTGDEEPIYFNEFYTETKFIIINWNGLLRAFDAEKQEKIFEIDLGGSTFTEAVFSPDKTKLHVAYQKNYLTHLLATFSLPGFTFTTQELPNKAFTRHLKMRNDGCLLGYYHEECEEEDTLARNKWVHGYYVFDPATSRVDHYAMEYAQRNAQINQAPVICANRNLGVMPYWGDIDVQWNENSEPLFPYKVVVFDLTNFNVLRIVTASIYTQSQLGNRSLSGDEMAKRLMERKPGEEYEDALASFYKSYSKELEESEDGVWLDWGHGRIVNLTNDSIPDREYSPLPMKIWKPSPIKWEFTPEAAQHLAERDKVVIIVDDLTQNGGFLEALDQMIELTEDIAALGRGGTLAFLVKDKGGLTLDDREFFHKALPHPGAPEKIVQVVENFIKYDGADSLYIDCEETALCYAVYELAQSSPQYIETMLRYLSVIDEEHDVFIAEKLIPMLMDVYGNTEHEPTIRKGILRASLKTGPWESAFEKVRVMAMLQHASLGRSRLLAGNPIREVRACFSEAFRYVLKSFRMTYDETDPDYIGADGAGFVIDISGYRFNAGAYWALIAADFTLCEELADWYRERRYDSEEVKGCAHALALLLRGEISQARHYLNELAATFEQEPAQNSNVEAARQDFKRTFLILRGIAEHDQEMFNNGLSQKIDLYSSFIDNHPSRDAGEEFLCDAAVALANLGLHHGLQVTVHHDMLPPRLLIEAHGKES